MINVAVRTVVVGSFYHGNKRRVVAAVIRPPATQCATLEFCVLGVDSFL